ncbi:MAG TPA: phytanoyl-CoA dioxygenase family protein [Bryobacteraceae bacterium]|jgi:ectoine hydroxylase-related dioxygenase (phytanoyl-CoA dioxygenase family)|nr:phytanoyl-CoA dioxygenase family protein [Bryobacteraceae bacterium]
MNAQRTELADHGFTILPGYMSVQMLERMRTRVDELFAEEGERAGSEFRQEENARRLANLVDKGEVFREAIASPPILGLVESVLGPEFKLSSLNVRSAPPHSNSLQPLHVDMGLLPDQRGYAVCNTVWMLDDFTEENGALRVVPGSHRLGRRPQDELADPNAIHPEEILVTGLAGTVVVMNAHLWHGGTANRTAAERRALHGFYCRRDVPQQQYQKKLLRPETQAALDPTLRRILALDDPMNDRLCETGSGQSGFLK